MSREQERSEKTWQDVVSEAIFIAFTCFCMWMAARCGGLI